MNKLRSDSAFCQLTPEQVDMLEGWLFEERLGYSKVLEKLKAELGLETSLTAVRRFYKRLDVERSAQSLMDAAEMSGLTVEALKSGELKPAMLLFANKCLFELLRQSPVPVKEVTTLLRAITSAEAHTMRQTIYEREQAELREAKRIREARESWRMTREDVEEEELRQEQEEAMESSKNQAPSTHLRQGYDGQAIETSNPKVQAEAEKGLMEAPMINDQGAKQNATTAQPPESKDEKGKDDAESTVTKFAGGAWQPSVVEKGEDAENGEAEEAENRLTPLSAA